MIIQFFFFFFLAEAVLIPLHHLAIFHKCESLKGHPVQTIDVPTKPK